MAIAICGMGPRELPTDRELWGMPWDPEWTKMDVMFELHHPSMLDDNHIERLQDLWQPLYMQDNFYNNATRYPIESAIEIVGDYFTCSISYMLAFAIYHKIDDIELHGVTGTEGYAEQRANIEYIIGIAKGRGYKVKVCGESELLKGERYGEWNGD